MTKDVKGLMMPIPFDTPLNQLSTGMDASACEALISMIHLRNTEVTNGISNIKAYLSNMLPSFIDLSVISSRDFSKDFGSWSGETHLQTTEFIDRTNRIRQYYSDRVFRGMDQIYNEANSG